MEIAARPARCKVDRALGTKADLSWPLESFQGYPATDDPLDLFKDTISRAALGMGAYSQAMQARVACNEAGVYSDMRASDETRCRGLEVWLTSPSRLKQLVLGAPILYAQPWLLPLWAQRAFWLTMTIR